MNNIQRKYLIGQLDNLQDKYIIKPCDCKELLRLGTSFKASVINYISHNEMVKHAVLDAKSRIMLDATENPFNKLTETIREVEDLQSKIYLLLNSLKFEFVGN